jgi:hypothetical protein
MSAAARLRPENFFAFASAIRLDFRILCSACNDAEANTPAIWTRAPPSLSLEASEWTATHTIGMARLHTSDPLFVQRFFATFDLFFVALDALGSTLYRQRYDSTLCDRTRVHDVYKGKREQYP